MTISLPSRLCARNSHEQDLLDSFLAVQAVCSNLHKKDVRDNFLTVQALCSTSTREIFA